MHARLRIARRTAAVVGLGMLAAAGGCVSEPVAEIRPPMPRIVSAPPAPAVSSAPAAAAPTLAELVALAERGDRIAISNALQRMDSVRQRETAAAIARAMLDRDLNAAAQWASSLIDIPPRVAAIRTLAETLLQRDPAGAMRRLEAVPLAERRVEFLSLAAAEWARRDAPAAVAWARALDDAELRLRTLTSIAFEVAQRTPERAIEIAGLLPPGRDRSLVLGAIGRHWAQRNAVAATNWAQQLPAGEARTAAVAGIESNYSSPNWPVRDPNAEAIAASTVPPPVNVAPPSVYGMQSDETLRREFQQRLERSPTLTGDWLSTLPPGDRRDEFTTKLTREWMAENPAAAKQWLDQNVPSDARRQQILFEAGVVASPRPQ